MTNDLTTNKTPAALLLESEQELVAAKLPPVELRTVPRAEWDSYINRDVTLPPSVFGFLLERNDGQPLTRTEVETIETNTEVFHGVSEPYHISMSLTMQRTGRAWTYLMEAGEYLTGLTLGKDEPEAAKSADGAQGKIADG